MTDHGGLAVEALRKAVAGDLGAIYGDVDALYGVASPGTWAGEIEQLLQELEHRHRHGVRRAARHVAASVVEGRPADKPRSVPLIVVHGPTWRVADGLGGYLPVQRELVVVEVGRLHDASTRVPVGEGGSRAMRPQEAYQAYGVTAERVRWTYGADGAVWDSETRTLDLPGARVRSGPVKRSKRAERWLELFCSSTELFLDWLATLCILDRPTSALQVRGPNSIGKALLVAALTTWLGGQVSYDEATGDFSGGLAHGPLVVLDEGAAESRPDAFRRLTANTVHRIRTMYRMAEDLLGCPRVIITSNEADPLRLGREELSSASEEALGRRLIVVEGQQAAADYLAELGGWSTTAGWTDVDGELVNHLRWLAQNRKVTLGKRFLVEGDAAAWVATAHTRRGVGADILAAYQAHQDDQELRQSCKGEPFVHDGDLVGVSPGALLRNWRLILGHQERVPSSQHLGRALRRLSGEAKPTRGGPEGERGPRRYWVHVDRLREEVDV